MIYDMMRVAATQKSFKSFESSLFLDFLTPVGLLLLLLSFQLPT